MRCLYREQRTLHGDYMDVDVYPVFKDTTSARKKKAKPSRETQELLNQANRERKLTWIMNENFTPDDVKFELTYKDELRPESDKRVMMDVTNFLDRIERLRKKKGLPELKRVAAVEKGSKKGRYHIHITMNGGLTPGEIAKKWGKGYVMKLQPLQFNEFGLAGIAAYFVKSPICGKHWTASKNLKTYERPPSNDYKYSGKKVREMAIRKDRAEIEKMYPEYYMSDCQVRGIKSNEDGKTVENEFNGGIYLRIRMYKKTAKLAF